MHVCVHAQTVLKNLFKQYHYSDTSDEVSWTNSVVPSSELSFQIPVCVTNETDINQMGLYCCCILKRNPKWQQRKGIYKGKELSMHVNMTSKRDRMKKIVIKLKIQQEY